MNEQVIIIQKSKEEKTEAKQAYKKEKKGNNSKRTQKTAVHCAKRCQKVKTKAHHLCNHTNSKKLSKNC